SYAAMAGIFGRRLAELHEVLSRPSDDDAFNPRASDANSANARAAAVNTMLAQALQAVEQQQWPDELAGARVQHLLEHADELRERISAMAHTGGGLQMRIHGDLHLGQILIAQ